MSENDLEAGMADLQAGRWNEGIERLRAVLAREPARAEVWSNLGFALRAAGRAGDAREALQRAISIAPHLADAWNLLGLVDQDRGLHVEAIASFERALALRPQFAVAVMNRANSDQALGRTQEAIAGYRLALAMAPANAGVHYNLGHLHQKITGRADEAIAHYREAIRLHPAFADAHLNLSHMLLLRGEWREGWQEFAWRPQRRAFAAARASQGIAYGMPRPEPWPPRIALVGEQGLGDMLFFLRFARLAAARGARLAFHGDARLHPMLLRTGLIEEARPEGAPPFEDRVEILVGDLPLMFPEVGETSALPPPLSLQPDALKRDAIERRLEEAGPPPWIALTWRAGKRSTGLFDRLFKEAPLNPLGEALRPMRATWISVQRAPQAGEREALERALGAQVHDFSAVNDDLDAALAIMDLVDDYVGVSNTNMYLRAGVERGARVLVPFAPEWRWGASGPSPWFARMTAYREAPGRDWSEALAALSRDMHA